MQVASFSACINTARRANQGTAAPVTSRGRRLNHQHPSNHRREMHLVAAPGPRPLVARYVTAHHAPHAAPSQSASREPGISCEPSRGPTRERQSGSLPASPAAVTGPIYAPRCRIFLLIHVTSLSGHVSHFKARRSHNAVIAFIRATLGLQHAPGDSSFIIVTRRRLVFCASLVRRSFIANVWILHSIHHKERHC